MTTQLPELNFVDPTWRPCLRQGLANMDEHYLQQLGQSSDWLPGPHKIFNAFSLPLDRVNYILFGESPYPRQASANGYAFWDNAVTELWSETGLGKKVNRATSLRNIMKMLLVAEGLLTPHDTSQQAIAALDKSRLVQTSQQLFDNFLSRGFLLLNATPVLGISKPQQDARAWRPFVREILACLLARRAQVQLILLGRIANSIDQLLPSSPVKRLYAEHPYNLSFITQLQVLDFFRPLHLLISS